MYISLDWIKKYTEINIDEETLVSKVRSQIGEVESVTSYSERYVSLVIAEVTKAELHADSDKLGVYQVKISDTKEVQVVAGDRTLEVGSKVVYFAPGTKIPYNSGKDSDGVIKKVKLGGIESEGMLASARELDVTNDHSKILVLDTDKAAGTPFTAVYDFDDTVLDIENKALANRPDCFGILGIAREIAAIQGLNFTSPDWYRAPDASLLPSTVEGDKLRELHIHNEAGSLCARYMAITMTDITVGDSPYWLQSLLLKSGIRPINNVVDITNYLMLLTGQPLHAFDYDKVVARDNNSDAHAHINVRMAKDGELITTIDGKSVTLDSTMVVIADSQSPIGVAGVMGGLDTEIDEKTSTIIIESANFDKYNVRKTSMKIGISSEAVTRYTKGQDAAKCENVLYKAAEMINDLAGGSLASQVHDHYMAPEDNIDIKISIDRLNNHLGTSHTLEVVKTILEHVELYSTIEDDDTLHVQIPSYRKDLNIPQDIHEEVGRLDGYDKIKLSLPSREIKPTYKVPLVQLNRAIRKIMIANGANELLTYNFTSLEQLKLYEQGTESAFRIRNPLSPELEFMRMSIVPSLLDKVLLNLKDGFEEVSIFELNKTHNKSEMENDLPIERSNLGYVFSTNQKRSGSPYYTAKAQLSKLLQNFCQNVTYRLIDDYDKAEIPLWLTSLYEMYDPNSSAILSVNVGGDEIILGIVGDLLQKVKIDGALPQYTSAFEISINELLRFYGESNISRYEEPSRYPAIEQDICLVMPANTQYNDVISELTNALGVKNLRNLNPTFSTVDIYQSPEQASADQKQITIRIRMQKADATLSTKSTAKEISKAIAVLSKKMPDIAIKE